MFERVNRLTIDDMISIMEIHNVTDKPVKFLSTGYSEHEILRVVLDILKAYRDTGLSPEEVQELAKAKAEGRLKVLPCKVGDRVYFPYFDYHHHYKNRVDSRLITGIRQNTNGAWQAIGGVLCFPFSEFGKTVFLTREDVEKAIGGGRDGTEV